MSCSIARQGRDQGLFVSALERSVQPALHTGRSSVRCAGPESSRRKIPQKTFGWRGEKKEEKKRKKTNKECKCSMHNCCSCLLQPQSIMLIFLSPNTKQFSQPTPLFRKLETKDITLANLSGTLPRRWYATVMTLKTPENWAVAAQHSQAKELIMFNCHTVSTSLFYPWDSLPEGRASLLAEFRDKIGHRVPLQTFHCTRDMFLAVATTFPPLRWRMSGKPPAEQSVGTRSALHCTKHSESFSAPSFVASYQWWKHTNTSPSRPNK